MYATRSWPSAYDTRIRFLFEELVPDRIVDTPRVARRWRKQIDDQGKNVDTQEIDRFHEVIDGRMAVFVARRYDFDHGEQSAKMVLDNDSVCFVGVRLVRR
jgi:hypothetical protein